MFASIPIEEEDKLVLIKSLLYQVFHNLVGKYFLFDLFDLKMHPIQKL